VQSIKATRAAPLSLSPFLFPRISASACCRVPRWVPPTTGWASPRSPAPPPAAADDVLPPLPPARGEEAGAEPKLEGFLGLQEPAAAVAGRPFAGSGGGASSIGLSMIKNWLRSQPPPGPAGADSMALAVVEEASTDEVRKVTDDRGAESVAAVVDAAQQRKAVAAVDTFGQRTSIYRGVTK